MLPPPGLEAVSSGQVGVLLLAGGQGTRLGTTSPKGMYDVGLPSGKSLYHLQAERLWKLQELAASLAGEGHPRGSVTWYIMTSEATKEPTIQYFQQNDYFGLDENDLVFFEQGTLPCFTFDGQIILQSSGKLAHAPDGNGGLYRALKRQNVVQDMRKRGIQYLHVYCVDNILVKMADPIFMGYCMSLGTDCGAKVSVRVLSISLPRTPASSRLNYPSVTISNALIHISVPIRHRNLCLVMVVCGVSL